MGKRLCWGLAGVMILSAVMLGGCSSAKEKLTAESILEQVKGNMESIQSVSGDVAMDMDMKISESGLGMNLSVGLDCAMEMTMEPEVIHVNGKLDMSLLGLSMDMEAYSVTEGDQAITYTKMNNAWTKSEGTAAGMGDLFDSFSSEADLTLQESTEKIGDKEVYVLTGEVSGDEMDALVGEMDSFTEGIGEVDLSGIKANATLKVYKDEMLPASVNIEITETGDAVEADGVSVEINSMSVEMNYTEFDTIESIEVPEEALAAGPAGGELSDNAADAGNGLNAATLEELQGAYEKAPEYEYMAVGYYFDGLAEDTVRDGYVPYEENFVQRDTGSLTGINHGISIRLTMTQANSASEALTGLLEDYTSRLEAQGLSVLDSDVPTTADDDTVGLLPAIYINGEGHQIFTVLYADIRDDGSVYMCAEMEFDESSFDDTTEALLAEIDDAYGLTLSSIFIEE